MAKPRSFSRSVAVTAAFALAVLFLSDTKLNAQSQNEGATLTGAWYLSLPTGAKGLFTFHKGGTVSGVVSFGFGGSPHPPRGPSALSADHGIWGRAGNNFELVHFRFLYDLGSGDALRITRIRLVFSLDPGFESASGEFFVTGWICPSPVECPDPNTDPPDVPEFAPPNNSFTMTRVRMP